MKAFWQVVAALLRLLEKWEREREYEQLRQEYDDIEADVGQWFDAHFERVSKHQPARKAAEARASKD